MGREANASLTFAGTTGTGKILLESTELILRGNLRARIPRSAITSFAADADDLVILSPQGPLRATLGAKEAALWVKALAKPPPSLAAKLGATPGTPVQIFGPITDPALAEALHGNTAPQAPVLIAELPDPAAFEAAFALLSHSAFTAFWGVTVKGKTSAFPESALRTRLRAAGYIDTKSCSVSEIRSATRFQRR